MTQGGKRRRIRIYEVTRVNHDVALRPVAKIHSFVGKIVTCNSPEVNSKVLNRAKATSSFRERVLCIYVYNNYLSLTLFRVARSALERTRKGSLFEKHVESIFDARECANLSRCVSE